MRNLFITGICLLLSLGTGIQAAPKAEIDTVPLRSSSISKARISEAVQRNMDYFFYEGLNL